MFSPRLLWFAAACGTLVGTFLLTRLALLSPPAVGSTLAVSAPASPPTTDLTAKSAPPENPLLARLRFLENLASSSTVELRQLFLGTGTSRRDQRAAAVRWAETDPASLLDFLKNLTPTAWARDSESLEAVTAILFRTWALQDPAAATAALDQLPQSPRFSSARWEIVKTLLSSNPTLAFAQATKLSHYSASPDRILDSVWKANPAAFLQASAAAPPGALRNHELRGLVIDAFSEVLKNDAPAAAAYLSALPPHQQLVLWPFLASRMAAQDPAAAQAWFAGIPPSTARENVGPEIVKALAKKDPSAALAWLQDNLQGGRTEAFANLADALADKGIAAAQQLMDAMPPGAQRDKVVSTIAQNWAAKDFAPALNWVLAMPADDPGRKAAIDQISSQWASKDPAGAADYLIGVSNQNEASSLRWQVSAHFATNDLPGGLAWAGKQAANPQHSAYRQLYVDAFQKNTLPKLYAALEHLPPVQQEETIKQIATATLQTSFSNEEANDRYLASLKLIPPHLRDTARTTIEKASSGYPDRKQSALDALK